MRFVPAVRLLGPMLWYDMVRLARRRRFIQIRCAYAILLAGILGMAYHVWYMDHGGMIQPNEMADFAAGFFLTFFTVQGTAIALLTPAYTAGAVAEEKERRTLEFILTTDLRPREIVLGKLTSRLAALGLLVFTGLPVLGFMQFMGGVDPVLVLAGFLATAVTMLSLAGLAILRSVQVRRARDAIISTYSLVLLYLVVSGLSRLLLELDPKWPSTATWDSPITLEHVVDWLSAANPFVAAVQIADNIGPKEIHDVVATCLLPYVLSHLAVALVCITWAVLRVRAIALRQSVGRVRSLTPRRVRRRPPVGLRPILWKEMYVEGRRRGLLWSLLSLVTVILSFVPALIILLSLIGIPFFSPVLGDAQQWEELSEAMNWWARIVGTAVVCFTLLAVGIRAAGSISGERERQTWDGLLTSPLESREILFGKALGSILGVRGGWIWAAMILAIGVLTRGVHLLAVPLLLAAWCSYAAFMANMGLWFSLNCTTTLRAFIGTIVAALVFSCGHWFLWICTFPFFWFDMPAWADQVPALLYIFQTCALSPPVTLGILAFNGSELPSGSPDADFVFVGLVSAVIGPGLYGIAAFIWWKVTLRRFRQHYLCEARPVPVLKAVPSPIS